MKYTENTCEMTVRELRALLAHADTADGSNRRLDTVQFEPTRGAAAASDGFTMAVVEDPIGRGDAPTLTVSRGELEKFIKGAKSKARVRVNCKLHTLTLLDTTGGLEHQAKATHIPEAPGWRRVFEATRFRANSKKPDKFGANPEFIARLTKIQAAVLDACPKLRKLGHPPPFEFDPGADLDAIVARLIVPGSGDYLAAWTVLIMPCRV